MLQNQSNFTNANVKRSKRTQKGIAIPYASIIRVMLSYLSHSILFNVFSFFSSTSAQRFLSYHLIPCVFYCIVPDKYQSLSPCIDPCHALQNNQTSLSIVLLTMDYGTYIR